MRCAAGRSLPSRRCAADDHRQPLRARRRSGQEHLPGGALHVHGRVHQAPRQRGLPGAVRRRAQLLPQPDGRGDRALAGRSRSSSSRARGSTRADRPADASTFLRDKGIDISRDDAEAPSTRSRTSTTTRSSSRWRRRRSEVFPPPPAKSGRASTGASTIPSQASRHGRTRSAPPTRRPTSSCPPHSRSGRGDLGIRVRVANDERPQRDRMSRSARLTAGRSSARPRRPAADERRRGGPACGGASAAVAAAAPGKKAVDPEQRLGHDGEPRPGLGRGVRARSIPTSRSRSRRRLRRRHRRAHQRHRRHRQLEPRASSPRRRRRRRRTTRQGPDGVHGRLRRARDLRPQGQSAQRDHASSSSPSIYGEGGKIDKWSQLGVKDPGRARDEDHPRQPPEQLRHLPVLPRARARRRRRLQARHRATCNGSKDVVELVGTTRRAPSATAASATRRRRSRCSGSRRPRASRRSRRASRRVLDKTLPDLAPAYMYTLGRADGAVAGVPRLDRCRTPGRRSSRRPAYVPLPAEPTQSEASL